MICSDGPEGENLQNEPKEEDEIVCPKKNRKVPEEGTHGFAELNTYRNPKTWKKSITDFFRNQLRSARSNDGEVPSGSNVKFEETEMRPEQKWQSLGKMFRRQSSGDHWKSPNSGDAAPSGSKRLNVRRVMSTYLGKLQKHTSSEDK